MHPHNEQVLVAVVVVVAHGDAHAVAFALEARLRRHVAERAIAIVLVEPVPVLRARLGERR